MRPRNVHRYSLSIDLETDTPLGPHVDLTELLIELPAALNVGRLRITRSDLVTDPPDPDPDHR